VWPQVHATPDAPDDDVVHHVPLSAAEIAAVAAFRCAM